MHWWNSEPEYNLETIRYWKWKSLLTFHTYKVTKPQRQSTRYVIFPDIRTFTLQLTNPPHVHSLTVFRINLSILLRFYLISVKCPSRQVSPLVKWEALKRKKEAEQNITMRNDDANQSMAVIISASFHIHEKNKPTKWAWPTYHKQLIIKCSAPRNSKWGTSLPSIKLGFGLINYSGMDVINTIQ